MSISEQEKIYNNIETNSEEVDVSDVDISAIDKDADDDKFLEVAVAGDADYIVTGDSHFDMDNFNGIKIVTARWFVDNIIN